MAGTITNDITAVHEIEYKLTTAKSESSHQCCVGQKADEMVGSIYCQDSQYYGIMEIPIMALKAT